MNTTKTKETRAFTATRNACKMCSPLGASVVFRGLNSCIPLIHGSQGCSTYIRRYMISHYKEPVDIASTNFTEDAAIFGGEANFETAVLNIIKQYNPESIAVASTCLSETIGDDMEKIIKGFKAKYGSENLPEIFYASTPSYKGTHMDGFHSAVLSLVKNFAEDKNTKDHVNIFPGFISPQDIRELKDILDDYELPSVFVSDYSETLDNPNWEEYKKIPEGGTTVAELKETGAAKASVELGRTLIEANETGATYLENNFGVNKYSVGLPMGIRETDNFFKALNNITGQETPKRYVKERGRLVDSYIDGHKYIFGKKAIVYGEEDFVIGMVSFLEEIGIDVVLCASGGNSGLMKKILKEDIKIESNTEILDGADFEEIAEKCKEIKPDILIGNSKGYYISRELGIPLVRVGFPIHDRVGGQRLSHLFYSGTQILFDKITNAIIEKKQDSSPVGYKFM
jgi:nitrogenase molybdenum-iron protein NifN